MTIVTTCGRPTKNEIEIAKAAAIELGFLYVERKKATLKRIYKIHEQPMLVVTKSQWEFYEHPEWPPFFFHPSSAMFRLKRIQRGERDPLIDAMQLKPGMSVLDCTLGFASDALIAAAVVGQTGRIVGCELSKERSFVLKQSIEKSYSPYNEFLRQIPQIEIVNKNSIDFLLSCRDNIFDVVYLDPMFDETITESVHMAPLRNNELFQPLSLVWIREAKRVAKKSVVLKAHFQSNYFQQFDFQQLVRPNTKFHYGVWSKQS